MRIAKLEMKVILAMILLGYEYELVDDDGNYPKAIPEQDRNDPSQVRSLCPCHLVFAILSLRLVATYRGRMLFEIQTYC